MNSREEQVAYQLIYAGCEPEPNRFTNDLPINADVWLAFKKVEFAGAVGLLLTPHLAAGVARLRQAVTAVLPGMLHKGKMLGGHDGASDDDADTYIAANESHVLANITFMQLVALLPLTSWWRTHISPAFSVPPSTQPTTQPTPAGRMSRPELAAALCDPTLSVWLTEAISTQIRDEQALRQFKQVGLDASRHPVFDNADARQREALRRLINVAALYVALNLLDEQRASETSMNEAMATIKTLSVRVLDALAHPIQQESRLESRSGSAVQSSPLWLVAVNRDATHAVYASRKTVKADAAIRVFDTGGQGVRWAVIDSGIDARHPAFARLDRLESTSQITNYMVAPRMSRVIKTLDFTRFAAITSGRVPQSLAQKLLGRMPRQELQRRVAEIENGLASGQMLDWSRIEPLLEIPHPSVIDASYEAPGDSHGTHVAGIIGANWRSETYERLDCLPNQPRLEPPTELTDSGDVCGVCPNIELLDLRVFNPRQGAQVEDGSDEFAILAALQYVRYLNQSKDRQYIHGVNLSLSLCHDVRSYGCGSTPVCLECERLVGSGVIVVAAAGNYGYDDDYGATHLGGAYRGQSITDPGNAPSVITVGSTHRSDPYQYGVSYFSSHGPTGDGRIKPDLVAPGEKVWSTVPGPSIAPKDGTSMAAPHVSGIAALLLSRNGELMGHPNRVKDILCKSASDLGRGQEFQGHGLIDALRALQSV